MRNSYAANTETEDTMAAAELDTLPQIRASAPAQDREVLLVDADGLADLRGEIAYLAEVSTGLPFTHLGRLAAGLQQNLAGRQVRAAVVAASGKQAAARFADLLAVLDRGSRRIIDPSRGIFLGQAGEGAPQPHIALLFPGQGSGKPDGDSALARRFEAVRDLHQTVPLPACADHTATAVAQPRIAIGSAAGLRVLSLLGIEACAAAGHSLGELTALHWAGAMTEAELVALAFARGQVMAEASEGGGAMVSVSAGPEEVEPLLHGEPVVIACYNGPAQTVISGPADAVERVREAATASGLRSVRVPVSHAFHSPAVAPAAAGLAAYLRGQRLRPLARQVVSTLTSDVVQPDTDLCQLLVRQLREPVRFSQAVGRLAAQADLFVEVGPGRVLSALAAKTAPDTPVIPLSTDGSSLSGVLSVAAAAHVLGVPARHDVLFADRFTTAGAQA
ncbi:MAG: acyltransferase domain-containing protein [Streptosporangiaceae bacterium]